MNDRHDFSEWLRTEKGYSDRSISDVFSRLKRANGLLPNHKMDKYLITDLEQVPDFESLSVAVKSQMRKAIRLKLAYLDYISKKTV